MLAGRLGVARVRVLRQVLGLHPLADRVTFCVHSVDQRVARVITGVSGSEHFRQGVFAFHGSQYQLGVGKNLDLVHSLAHFTFLVFC